MNGRYNISWDKKFELDVYYVDHLSFAMDCRVILTTIKKVLFREDINNDGEDTTTEFLGSDENKTVSKLGDQLEFLCDR